MIAALAIGALFSGTPRAVILTYHDFVERRGPGSVWFDCTTAEFTAQLDALARRGARFGSMEEFESSLRSGRPLPPKTVLLTFADGYEGFFKRAWPILKRRRIPAVMFVHTRFVGDRHGRPKMTWEQLKTLDASGLVRIASQTVTHPADLRALGDAEITSEFVESKRVLAGRLGRPCEWLAYPNGKCDARCANLARAAGYRLAFSEVTRPTDRAPSPYLIPRYVHTKWDRAWSDLVKERARRHR